jgi:cell division protein ZapB
MEAELSSLEQRVRQLVDLCIQLRKANFELRQQLVSSAQDNKTLADKVSEARVRLETLLDQIGEGSNDAEI